MANGRLLHSNSKLKPQNFLRSTLILLRLPFSFFLLPVFLFALSQPLHIDRCRAALVFVILHGLIYPASNAYNSFMDRDTNSIGLLKNPPLPTRRLYVVSIMLDLAAVLLSLFISIPFTLGVILFITASKMYSWRRIRVKKYPIAGFITAAFFQGAWVYWLVYHGTGNNTKVYFPWLPMSAATLLIGSFYPLTQIYQHEQDREDRVKTLSMLVGIKNTFPLSAAIFTAAMLNMGAYFTLNLELERFLVFMMMMLPVVLYFFWWWRAVYRNEAAANFKNSLRMNIVAACCTNAGFLYLLFADKF